MIWKVLLTESYLKNHVHCFDLKTKNFEENRSQISFRSICPRWFIKFCIISSIEEISEAIYFICFLDIILQDFSLIRFQHFRMFFVRKINGKKINEYSMNGRIERQSLFLYDNF